MTVDATEQNSRLIALSEYDELRLCMADYDELSAPERVFRLVWDLESEVNNGGFWQYFANSSGALAPHAPNGLRAIGANAATDIARHALDLALPLSGNTIPWNDDESRQELMQSLDPEKFEKLNEKLFQYPDDLTALLYRYVSQHSDAIAGAEKIVPAPA